MLLTTLVTAIFLATASLISAAPVDPANLGPPVVDPTPQPKMPNDNFSLVILPFKPIIGGYDPVFFTLYRDKNFRGEEVKVDVAEPEFLTCISLKDKYASMVNQVTSYKVTSGCCGFYKGEHCTERLFLAYKRSDEKIGRKVGGENNDATSAIMCNHTCTGL